MGREKTGRWERALVWGALVLALTSCGSGKVEACARLRPVLLAQFRTHAELAEHLRDAGTCEAQAQRLRAQVATLRALSVSDARLSSALSHYVDGVEGLAGAYGEAARAQRDRPEGALRLSPVELRNLASRLTAHVTEVDSAGLSLLGACGEP